MQGKSRGRVFQAEQTAGARAPRLKDAELGKGAEISTTGLKYEGISG